MEVAISEISTVTWKSFCSRAMQWMIECPVFSRSVKEVGRKSWGIEWTRVISKLLKQIALIAERNLQAWVGWIFPVLLAIKKKSGQWNWTIFHASACKPKITLGQVIWLMKWDWIALKIIFDKCRYTWSTTATADLNF